MYRATGVAKTPAFTWILEVGGGLRPVTYQDPPGPTAGRRYSLVGTLMVSWDYEWDLAMEPSEGGGPFDGRRRWTVADIRIGRPGWRPVDQVPRWPSADYWLSLLPAG